MRRSSLVVAILTLFLTTLVVTTVAEARAGRGFSSGSRGSRSYSAPRSPSTPASPVTPSTPGSPQRSLSPTQPQRPGGLFGGFGGMLGGFVLGGLLGSLLFGGLGHGLGGFGGVGLLDILLIGGLIWLAVAFFRRRQPEPAYAGAAGAAAWRPGATIEAEAASPGAPVAAVDEDLEAGIAAIRAMDPGFTPVRFAAEAREMFLRLQTAWSRADLGPARDELTDEMADSLEADLARLRAERRVNRLEGMTVESARPTEAWQEYGKDFVTVRFRARGLDYTVDEATGAVVAGSNAAPTDFEEYWTFTRPVGPHPWRLSALQQGS